MLNPDDFYFNILDDGTESYIKSEDEEGNYTLLSPSGLNYYDVKTEETIQYNKKIAFGTAEDNEYIDLTEYNFDNVPSIDVTPKIAPVYSKDYEQSYQSLVVDYSELSKTGFRAHCRLDTDDYADVTPDEDLGYLLIGRYSSDDPIEQTKAAYSDSGTGCIGFEATCEISIEDEYGTSGNTKVELKLYKYREDGNHEFVETFKTVEHSDPPHSHTFTASTMNLPPDKYRVRYVFTFATMSTIRAWLHFREEIDYYGAEEGVLTGSINWLAIE